MAKTRQDKIASIEEQIAKLQNQKKQELQKHRAEERNLRTKRLIDRGAILESLIKDAKDFTNDQIHSFLNKTITGDFAKGILDEMRLESADADDEKRSDADLSSGISEKQVSADATKQNGTDENPKTVELNTQSLKTANTDMPQFEKQNNQATTQRPNSPMQQSNTSNPKPNGNNASNRNQQHNGKQGVNTGQSG